MTELQLDFCEIVYNEANNEIRLLVNSVSKDATLFTLDSSNLMNVLEALSESGETLLKLNGQPMIQQDLLSDELYEEEDGEYEENCFFNYRIGNDDLSEFYKGEAKDISLYLGSEEAQMVNSALWSMGQVLDFVMG